MRHFLFFQSCAFKQQPDRVDAFQGAGPQFNLNCPPCGTSVWADAEYFCVRLCVSTSKYFFHILTAC